ARQAFDEIEAVAQDEGFLVGEDRNAEIGVRGHRIVLVDRPVEARHAVAALDADALEHDVVAGFGVIVGVAVLAVENVVADDGGVEHQFRVLARERIEAAAAFQPVVAGLAEQEIHTVAAHDEVVADAAHHRLAVGAGDQEVVTLIAEDQRETAAAMDDVVSFLAVEEIHRADVGAGIGDDVVPRAAVGLLDAIATLEAVVAVATPDRVVAFTGDDVVIAVRALDDHMLAAIVADVVDQAVAVRIPTVDQLGNGFEIGVVVRGIVEPGNGDLLG